MRQPNHTCKISVRFSEDQKNNIELNAAMAGITVSSYIRNVVSGSKPPIHKFDKAMMVQISKIGNNLNQIARYVNLNKSIDQIVLKHIISIDNDLEGLLSKTK